MAGWFEIQPTPVALIPSAEADKLVEELEELAYGDDSEVRVIARCPDTDYVLAIEFEFSQTETMGGPRTIAGLLHRFVEHIEEGFFVHGEYDHQAFSYSVGTAAQLKRAGSRIVLEDFLNNIQELLPCHLAELIRKAQQRRFQLTLEGETVE